MVGGGWHCWRRRETQNGSLGLHLQRGVCIRVRRNKAQRGLGEWVVRSLSHIDAGAFTGFEPDGGGVEPGQWACGRHGPNGDTGVERTIAIVERDGNRLGGTRCGGGVGRHGEFAVGGE